MPILSKIYPFILALAIVTPGLVFIEFVANQCGYTYNVFSSRQERLK